MRQKWFGHVLNGARKRLSKTPRDTPVTVDRDELRTVLLQCEHDVRDIHRLLQKSAVLRVDRPEPPTPRY